MGVAVRLEAGRVGNPLLPGFTAEGLLKSASVFIAADTPIGPAYLGYGRAERLLLAKHPARFSKRGDAKWQGFIYGGGPVAALLKQGEALLDQPWRAPSAAQRSRSGCCPLHAGRN